MFFLVKGLLMNTLEQEHFIQVCNYFFTGKRQVPANEQPRMVFVFSSPGAGKSTRSKPLLQKSFATSPVLLEIDELKAFIPAGDNIDKTADDWFCRIVDGALDLKYNIIIFRQRSMLQLKQTRDYLKKARQNGYRTEVCILALDKQRSRLGMVHRYEFALENYLKNPAADDVQNYPRKPDFIKHGVFFAALPIIVRMSEKSKYVERIDVYSRQGEHLAFLDKNSNLKSELTPLQALRKERRRPWIYLERNKYNHRRQEVEEKMRQRKAGLWDKMMFRWMTSTAKSRK